MPVSPSCFRSFVLSWRNTGPTFTRSNRLSLESRWAPPRLFLSQLHRHRPRRRLQRTAGFQVQQFDLEPSRPLRQHVSRVVERSTAFEGRYFDESLTGCVSKDGDL